MRFDRKASLGVAALVGALALGTSAHAAYLPSLTVNKCLSAKIKQDGKSAAADTGCTAKGASKAIPTDAACIAKTTTKSTAAYAKLDGKGNCLTTGDATSADNAVQAYATSVDTAVGHGAAGAGKCDSAKQKLVGKYVAAITGCYAKAAGKGGTVDGLCTSKALDKLTAGITKVEAKGPCTNTNDTVPAADAFIQARACALNPSNPGCTPPCTPGTTRNVTVSFTGSANVAGITVDLDYPEAKVSIPGTGSDQSVSDRISGTPSSALVAANDTDTSVSVGIVKTTAFPAGQLFILQFDNCVGAPVPTNAEFPCIVTEAADRFGTVITGVSCLAVVN